jgi:hypothetical protein
MDKNSIKVGEYYLLDKFTPGHGPQHKTRVKVVSIGEELQKHATAGEFYWITVQGHDTSNPDHKIMN